MTAHDFPSTRGELIDIGGRRMRAVLSGPAGGPGPTVILESGAFGFSADWSVVQERLAGRGIRSLAYDRAGLGFSDPGPEPRDGLAIVADLAALRATPGESGPFVLCGHSMAGLHVRLFAVRNPARVRGVVLVDAATPEVMDSKLAAGFVEHFARASRLAAWGADNGLLRPLIHAGLGDAIGLAGPAKAEKRWAFAHGPHNRWAAAEVAEWTHTAGQARAAGPFDPELPVGIVLAGTESSHSAWKGRLMVPAGASRHGFVQHIRGASHASILGVRHADAIVTAIEAVIAAGAPC
ncbi:MAG: alpha/beta fold hydrolase [Caulobacteraceae bacterium]